MAVQPLIWKGLWNMTKNGTIWRHRAHEWVGRGPQTRDLGEKDCLWRDGLLPAWWLLLSTLQAYNGKAAPLTVWLEGTPHVSLISVSLLRIWAIDGGQINLAAFEKRQSWMLPLCLSRFFFFFLIIFFDWCFHLGLPQWSFYVHCVPSAWGCAYPRVPRHYFSVHGPLLDF